MTSKTEAITSTYLPGLHGLRFFAALLVVIFHCHGALMEISTKYWINHDIVLKGHLAVDFFFILSGFLLTYLAINEYAKNGIINIKGFYKRRALRILPLYYLSVAMGFLIIGVIYPMMYNGESIASFSLGEGFLYYLFFLPNWVVVNWEKIGPTFSLWSIGVEEQFYLLFPLIVFLPLKKRILLFSLITWFAVYFSFFFANELRWINLDEKWHRLISFTLRFHFLLWGCLLGYFFYYYKDIITRVLGNYVMQIVVIGAMLYTMLLKTEVQDNYHLKAGLAFSILMLTVTLPKSLIKMDWQPLKYLGVISYGIYIFHPFVSIAVRFAMQKSEMFKLMIEKNHWSFYLLVLSVTVLVAHLSYRYYESYFLKKKMS